MRVVWFGVVLLCVAGCSSKGTCVVLGKGSAAGADMCWVNYSRGDCEDEGDENKQAAFFSEDSEAGLARCRGDGFGTQLTDEELQLKLEEGETITMPRVGQ